MEPFEINEIPDFFFQFNPNNAKDEEKDKGFISLVWIYKLNEILIKKGIITEEENKEIKKCIGTSLLSNKEK